MKWTKWKWNLNLGKRRPLTFLSHFPIVPIMAATVLGKRTRSAVDSEGKFLDAFAPSPRSSMSILTELLALPVRTASKRRTLAPRAPREDAAPVSIRRTRSNAKRSDQLPDKENGDVNKISDKAPSKHTLREDQGGSPIKINSHFRTSKLVEGKLRESEDEARTWANELFVQKRLPPLSSSKLRKSLGFEMHYNIRR